MNSFEECLECPLCGLASRSLGRVPTINPASAQRVDLLECTTCGHWWHSPMPTQSVLTELYRSESAYVVSAGAREAYQTKHVEDTFSRFVKEGVKANGGRCLEIGAGGGQLMRTMAEYGYETFGVDPAQWVENSRIVPDISLIPSSLKFEVIVLQDVLEHMTAPYDALRRLRDVASPSSLLFCSFPFNESRPARRQGATWNMVRPFGHLHYFSRASAKQMFDISGWRLLKAIVAGPTPMATLVRALDIRAIGHALLKGSRDQLYVSCTREADGTR